ncbi:hypothetical protein VFPPC_16290 [Pochonia chlamydosporia 170]|uniref:Uncharacterized protein n=1 Tax=Pochonia chlamydosporia 170 TaxID=1380566 RepID=A0A179FI73_METCM|nr:hypothetical protein VFPPC_16290 [Pochonia chlamydosporia 170]OAQ64978.1 hypothetical protein VFPPC_16290 [Pochonia chlamydosporia 170]
MRNLNPAAMRTEPPFTFTPLLFCRNLNADFSPSAWKRGGEKKESKKKKSQGGSDRHSTVFQTTIVSHRCLFLLCETKANAFHTPPSCLLRNLMEPPAPGASAKTLRPGCQVSLSVLLRKPVLYCQPIFLCEKKNGGFAQKKT